MKLSEHFSLSEFEYSATAIRYGIDNSVPYCFIPSLKNLCEQVLEPLRQHVRQPMVISSRYRCPELNKLVGGSPTSQHLKGEAADIYIPDPKKLLSWYNYLKQSDISYDQLLLERKGNIFWLHVSCKPNPSKNRRQVLRITKRV